MSHNRPLYHEEMRQFLRKMRVRDPIPVTMSGVRMGERILQVGINDPRLAGTLAAKVGLSGHAAIAVSSEDAAERARQGAADVGGLVDVHVAPLDALPLAAGEFDVVVVHSADGLLAAAGPARVAMLRECHRVLRPGGRVIIIEAAARSGLGAIFGSKPHTDPEYEQAGGAVAALESAGFRLARRLGESEGFRFTEGLKGS